MPYASDSQRRFFHTPTGMKKVGAEKVEEFDEMSKGMDLPERSKSSKAEGRKRIMKAMMKK